MRKIKEIQSLSVGFCLALFSATVVPAQSQYIGLDSPVGLPDFVKKDGTRGMAGKGFAIQWFRGRKLLLTPFHCQMTDYGAEGLKDNSSEIASVEVKDFKNDRIVATAGPPLFTSGKPIEKCPREDCSDDLLAYELRSNSRMPLIPLCPTLAPEGTKVWVLSKTLPASDYQPEKFPGVITWSGPGRIDLVLDRPLTAKGSSGAPILNAKNELVGMLLGADKAKRVEISASPSVAIYARLLKLIGK